MIQKLIITIFLNLVFLNLSYSQEPGERSIHAYTLTIDKEFVNFTGKEVMGMTFNGSIICPLLEFTDGEQASIALRLRKTLIN